MQEIVKLPLSAVRDSPSLAGQIQAITAENYANPSILLDQEYVKNTDVYLSISETDELQAFFMVGWSYLAIRDIDVDCIFLGLSAVSAAHKGTGLAKALYLKFFSDAGAVTSSSKPVLWWGHTASPIVLNALWKLALDMSPLPDGRIPEHLASFYPAIMDHFGLIQYQDPTIACVLREFAKARYDTHELTRLKHYHAAAPLLEKWKIDESKGDRILLLGRCIGT